MQPAPWRMDIPKSTAVGLLAQLAAGRGALLLLLAVNALVHLATLTRWPPPYVDEAYTASHAWGLIHTGLPSGPLQSGVLDRFDGYWTFYSWIGSWLPSLPIQVFGLSLFSMRLWPLLCGLLLLVAIATLGASLGDRRTGLIAATLTSISPTFIGAAHQLRPDIVAAVGGFGAIAIYLRYRERDSLVAGFIAGLAIAVSFNIHLNAVLYGPIVVALFLHDCRLAVWRQRSFWAFILGSGIGPVWYLVEHHLRYPQTVATLTRILFGTTKLPPIVDPRSWGETLDDTTFFLLRTALFHTPLIIGGLVVLARRRTPADRRLLIIVSLLLIEMLALLPYRPPYYQILVSPALDLLVAALLVGLLTQRRSRLMTVLAALVVVPLLTFNAALAFTPLRRDAHSDYQRTLAQIDAVIPAGSVIMGEPKYWLGFTDHRYMGWQQLAYYRGYAPGSSLDDAFNDLRPDVLILDTPMEWHITDDPSAMASWAQLVSLPKTPLERFLARQARLVAQIETETSGTVRVYQIDWSR